VFTGDVSPDKRGEKWESPKSVIFATPQVVQNDLVASRISLDSVTHLTFDECHRATGDYSYTYIAERYWKDTNDGLVTGLSASPGNDRSEILTVAQNLGVKNIEVVTENDENLQSYLYETTVEPLRVSLDDEIHEMRDLLYDVYSDNLKYLKDAGVLDSRDKYRTGFKQLQRGMGKARELDDDEKYTAMSLCSEAMKVNSVIEVLETQGVNALENRLEKLEKEAGESDSSKAVKRFVGRDEVEKVKNIAASYSNTHPKKTALLASLKDVIMNDGQSIVFTQYRETALELVEYLNGLGPVNAHRFVGQNNDDGHGMNQSQQKEILQDFRDGEYNVLVATSVAEEGLDIPQVGLVVFYEPVPSGVRSIQRRGRTGRADKGQVKVLIAEGTRDEGYWHASKSREDKMEAGLESLADMSSELNEELGSNQQSLSEYNSQSESDSESETDEEVTISVDAEKTIAESTETEQSSPDSESETIEVLTDTREMSSNPPRIISLKEEFEVKQEQLEVGDFILSDRTAIERKSAQDFADTIVDSERSIFEQLGDLVNNYSRPILLLEGTQDALYDARNIHPNSIRGVLSSLAVDFGVSVLWARDEEETAELLMTIAKREQQEDDREVSNHGKKSAQSDAEKQEYIVSSLAGIGPVTAQSLLQEFGSVHGIMNADVTDLQEADGVGQKTAESIYEIIRLSYS